MPSVPTSVLLSGLSSTALVQVQASVDGAIAVAGNVYQSVSLFHKTSILDVRHEFATLSATLVRYLFSRLQQLRSRQCPCRIKQQPIWMISPRINLMDIKFWYSLNSLLPFSSIMQCNGNRELHLRVSLFAQLLPVQREL